MRKLMALESLEETVVESPVAATLTPDQSGLIDTSEKTLDTAKEESRKVDALVSTNAALENLYQALNQTPNQGITLGFARSMNVAVEHMQRSVGVTVKSLFAMEEMNGHMSRVLARKAALETMSATMAEIKSLIPA